MPRFKTKDVTPVRYYKRDELAKPTTLVGDGRKKNIEVVELICDILAEELSDQQMSLKSSTPL